MFPCSTCANAYCEDCLPTEARFLESCERMEKLGFELKNGVYVHCSKHCEEVAITEFGYQVPGKKPKLPCPPALDLSSHFGGEVDESVEAPEDLKVTGKRRRKVVNYAQSDRTSTSPAEQKTYTGVPGDWFDDRQGKRWKENEEPWDPKAAPDESDDDDDEIVCLGTTSQPTAPIAKNVPSSTANQHASQTYRAPQSAAFQAATKQIPPVQSVPREYEVSIPISVYGLLLNFGCFEDGSTRFTGYRKDPHGRPGVAELEKCFRGFDKVIAVDGQQCEGKVHEEVCAMLKDFEGKERKTMRMRPV